MLAQPIESVTITRKYKNGRVLVTPHVQGLFGTKTSLPLQKMWDAGLTLDAMSYHLFTNSDAILPGHVLTWSPSSKIPQTQKALSVFYLDKIMSMGSHRKAFLLRSDIDLILVEKNWDRVKQLLLHQVFARPCPKTPRHGFVDSRVIGTVKELHDLWLESRKADPEAELILASFIDKADFNLVITPNLTTVGPGHDGATAGVDTVSVPIKFNLSNEDKTKVGIAANDAPYAEAVIKGLETFATQLRGGPQGELGNSVDFCPYDNYTVTSVIKADGDLLKWEQLMVMHAQSIFNNLKGQGSHKLGVVTHGGPAVDHVGGSMLSHYAVHARLNGVPVFTSRTPVKDEVLSITASQEEWDTEAMIAGMRIGFAAIPQVREAGYQPLLSYACGVLQNIPDMVGPYSIQAGAAIGILYALGMAAAYGEGRHCSGGGAQLWTKFLGSTKQHIYPYVCDHLHETRLGLGDLFRVFWKGPEETGYGGKKWGRCTKSIIDLDTCIVRFLRKPSNKGANEVAGAANQVLAQAHNGGWWLNKFGAHQTFDWAAQGNPFISMSAAPIVYLVGHPQLVQQLEGGKFWPWDAKSVPIKLAATKSPAQKKAEMAIAKEAAEKYQLSQKEMETKKANNLYCQEHPGLNDAVKPITLEIDNGAAPTSAYAVNNHDTNMVDVIVSGGGGVEKVSVPFDKVAAPFLIDWIETHSDKKIYYENQSLMAHQLKCGSHDGWWGVYTVATMVQGHYVAKFNIKKKGEVELKPIQTKAFADAVDMTPSNEVHVLKAQSLPDEEVINSHDVVNPLRNK